MDNLQLNGNGRGNERYSAKAMAKPINFLCIAPDAQEVSVIGDFNEWNGESHAMNRHFDGSWSTQIDLHHGHHRYQFLIDGKPSLDPSANGVVRNEQNERVSLIAVS
jgi:1,4-alpha-glucan branching enzyme